MKRETDVENPSWFNHLKLDSLILERTIKLWQRPGRFYHQAWSAWQQAEFELLSQRQKRNRTIS